jgi:hypothetical protein
MSWIRPAAGSNRAHVFGATDRRGAVELAMPKRRHQGTIRIGSVVAKEIDERDLDDL